MSTWNKHRWWIVRAVLLPVYIFVFAMISFFLVRSIPGDPVTQALGQNYTQKDYDNMQRALGLDGSLLTQFFRYVGDLLHGDFGTSISSGRPVLADFFDRMPSTLELAVLSLGISIILSAAAAYMCVMRPRWAVSKVVGFYARTAGSIPDYVLAIVGLFVFYVVLGWAPSPVGRLASDLQQPPTITGLPLLDAIISGYGLAALSIAAHYVLPLAVLILANSAIVVRILIEGLASAVRSAPVRFRVAAGATHGSVVLSMFRQAAPGAITMCGTLFGYLLGGAVILETLFGFVGIGQYVVNAVKVNDVTAIQGFLVLIAAVSLIVFLLIDIVNMVVDPRRRPGTIGGEA
jgi:ABC-type dipeptide/oligopeptide/nickel transport system permease component